MLGQALTGRVVVDVLQRVFSVISLIDAAVIKFNLIVYLWWHI